MKYTVVSRDEFYAAKASYHKRLEVDVCYIVEPPLVTYNDFDRGPWPHSIVFAESRDRDSNVEYRIYHACQIE